MRSVVRSCAALILGALVGCGAPVPGSPALRYLTDRGFRRSELEASLVNPQNGYSQRRLERYAIASDQGWDALPEWNPPTELVSAPAPPLNALSPAAAALPLELSADDEAALLALGQAAFFRYPVQLLAEGPYALASSETAARYGLWSDPVRGLGGLERVALSDGSIAIAYTCATCHASLRDGALQPGVANERLDFGRLYADASPPSESAIEAALRAWGPGRVDVTTVTRLEPVRIPDLRPVRWLTHLHADATVKQRDLPTLAIRLETLLILANGETARPPRIVSLALAAYVWSLSSSLPSAPATSGRGAQLFRDTCTGCHEPPALTGPPVPLAVIGTDPTLGLSLDRGTGSYRVSSLHGVGARRLLLHDGAVSSLGAMFDPARLDAAYTGGVRPGAVPGHVFGLELDAGARADLVTYLETL
jgi:hypothetical protein